MNETRIVERFLFLPKTLPHTEPDNHTGGAVYETRWLCYALIEQQLEQTKLPRAATHYRLPKWKDHKWTNMPLSGELSQSRPLLHFADNRPANA